jgi:hypothetical protein
MEGFHLRVRSKVPKVLCLATDTAAGPSRPSFLKTGIQSQNGVKTMLELLQNDYELEEMDSKEDLLFKKTPVLDPDSPRRDGLKVFLLYI